MVKDFMEHAKRCQACQFHANYIHQVLETLRLIVSSWPFNAWGIEVVGLLPKSSKEHMYILVATGYFSIWDEVVPLSEVKKEIVVDFTKLNINFRYGIPRYIIIDNGMPFDNNIVRIPCKKLIIVNGMPFDNKIKTIAKNKRDYHEKFGKALWAYRTTFKLAIQATLYFLVYGIEAVLLLGQ
uniref:Uncharacterized protein LOC104230726 n=1 Tax=Nicotiana sylvestris TaxID=4096 RepID=A0A1U7WTI1_NICSY|nr:PREDICTED: uncharacterized protein LOC104230726 [Nicotiana sylvestris]